MYASPSDNYWLVGDQPDDVRWSSGRVLYVADSDATYVAWLAAGYEISIIATERELADLLNATYPAGSPIPPVPTQPTPGGNGPIYLGIITATPTVMALADDFTFAEKSPVELIPRTAEFRDGLLDKVGLEKETPGGVTPFSALSGNITVPTGVYRLVLTGQAPGGGGAGIGTTTGPGAAGAGGAGETRKVILNVTPGDVIPYTIGAEGSGGVNQNSGSTGADLVIGAAAAAYPVVASSALTNDQSFTTNGNVNLPAGLAATDLLILYVTVSASVTTIPTITVPAGFTQLISAAFGNASRDAIFWKLASGSEGATLSIVTNIVASRTCVALKIRGHDLGAAPIEQAGASEGGSPNKQPNPPNLVPSWGSKSTLWIASANAPNIVPFAEGSVPSGYENGLGDYGTRVATHNSNATSQNPGVFQVVWSGSVNWNARTLAVLPAVPASILVCKGGTNGVTTPGGGTGNNGSTPTGSGGIRIDPVMQPHNMLSSGGCTSVGGATIYGSCPQRVNSAGAFAGLPGSGYGSGGAGAIHNSAASQSGGAGAPGMIYIEGYGLDAGSQS